MLRESAAGGEVDWVEAAAPAPVEIAEEGAEPIKAAAVRITLVYTTDDPLG